MYLPRAFITTTLGYNYCCSCSQAVQYNNCTIGWSGSRAHRECDGPRVFHTEGCREGCGGEQPRKDGGRSEEQISSSKTTRRYSYSVSLRMRPRSRDALTTEHKCVRMQSTRADVRVGTGTRFSVLLPSHRAVATAPLLSCCARIRAHVARAARAVAPRHALSCILH